MSMASSPGVGRRLLPEAYAFGAFATIAFWAGNASFCLAVVMAVLVALGFWHARRTPPGSELLPGGEPHRRGAGHVAAMPTTEVAASCPPSEPSNGTAPKVKIPPSAATSQ